MRSGGFNQIFSKKIPQKLELWMRYSDEIDVWEVSGIVFDVHDVKVTYL